MDLCWSSSHGPTVSEGAGGLGAEGSGRVLATAVMVMAAVVAEQEAGRMISSR